MIYNLSIWPLLWRFLALVASYGLFFFSLQSKGLSVSILVGAGAVLFTIHLYLYLQKRYIEVSDFLNAIRYRDFTRWYPEASQPQDIKTLHHGFNEVNRTIKAINNEKEMQHIYLQKMLELMDSAIIAWNADSGEVLWMNESLRNMIEVPTFKNVSFVAKRNPQLYSQIFDSTAEVRQMITLSRGQQKQKTLISRTEFTIEGEEFQLAVLKNVEDTLNETESEAWKKLLSVMTHEIMNSIAPISSLANTLHNHLEQAFHQPDEFTLEQDDILSGIETISKRSEGLMKFAQTYRSLNKITSLNVAEIHVKTIFDGIIDLLKDSFSQDEITIETRLQDPNLRVEMDAHLIEQVLINLLLNARQASAESEDRRIILTAEKTIDDQAYLKVIDFGKGIPDEIADKIFIPFFSTRKSGSGIGLSLCKQIMLLHKGNIQMNSDMGKGTVFTLVFPPRHVKFKERVGERI